MLRKFWLLLGVLCLTPTVFAQRPDLIEELQSESDSGSVVIVQNEQARLVMNKYANTLRPIKGYRIRLYSGSGVGAKENAEAIRAEFLMEFPYEEHGQMPYIRYSPPNYKVYVGDFLTESEALKFQKVIFTEFPYAFYVNDNINMPNFE